MLIKSRNKHKKRVTLCQQQKDELALMIVNSNFQTRNYSDFAKAFNVSDTQVYKIAKQTKLKMAEQGVLY